MSCGCNQSPCNCGTYPNNVGYQGCDSQIPACVPVLPQQEPTASQLMNLEMNLFGPFTVTVSRGRGIWSALCSASATVAGYPRNTNEGFICYILRILNILFTGNAPGGFALQIFSLQQLQSTPTANGNKVAGFSVVPTLNVVNTNELDFYLLVPGNSGVLPNDYNATTNNVSWFHVLGVNNNLHVDPLGNIQVFDSVHGTWRSLTDPNGVLTIT